MLASRRKITGLPKDIRTPLLLPALSSKCDVPIVSPDGLNFFSEFVSGPILISAYDVAFESIQAPHYANVVFLDSGGYEALCDYKAAERGDRRGVDNYRWTEDAYQRALSEFSCPQPVVAVSYDHPDERASLNEQLDRAERLFAVRSDVIQEFLIKPEPGDIYVAIETIVANLKRLSAYPIIGVTDKELGNTLLDKMLTIGRLRRALDVIECDIPIHVFGSLDPLTAPLYFIAGADVFDGLAWLRYAFHAGRAIYPQNYDAIRLGERNNNRVNLTNMWNDNYTYMARLEDAMRLFLQAGDYGQFEFDGDLLARAYVRLDESLKE